jgi:hypothetical protein
MAIANMPIYRQLFDYLCDASALTIGQWLRSRITLRRLTNQASERGTDNGHCAVISKRYAER